jgi:hypothetical protein
MKNKQEIENKAHLLWGETLHNERITAVLAWFRKMILSGCQFEYYNSDERTL